MRHHWVGTKYLWVKCLGSLALVLLLAACGGGGGGGGGGSPQPLAPPVADLTGTWNITENIDHDCAGDPPRETYEINVTQNGNNLTVEADVGTFHGVIDGNSISWTGSYPEDEGTTTITSMSLTVSADGNSISGTATWAWTDGRDSCSGTSQVHGVRARNSGLIPTAPTNLVATAVSLSSIVLNWTDTSDNETRFKIERSTPLPDSFVQIAFVNAGVTTFTDSGLSPSTIYHYRIRAANENGDSVYSDTVDAMTLSPTGAAIALSTTSVSFSVSEGTNPSPQTVGVSNVGTGSLTGLSASVAYGRSQPTGWLKATLSTTAAPAVLSLQATTSTLSAGTYKATVSVSSTAATNSPQRLSVTLEVVSSRTGSVKVITSTTGTNIDTTGYVVSITVGGGLARTTNIGVNSYVFFSDLSAGSHSVELTDVAANCVVNGSNPRSVNVTAGDTTLTTFNIVCQAPAATRQVTLKNQMSSSLNIHDIVQVKIVRLGELFTRNDLLTDDPAECLRLPGESISPGQSRTFDVTLGDNYQVFIGIGIWDLDSFFCPSSSPFFKRRFFTETNFNIHYVWTTVRVTDHTSGNWVWTISGSYLNGTLTVTPTGNSSIPFNVTNGNPIP